MIKSLASGASLPGVYVLSQEGQNVGYLFVVVGYFATKGPGVKGALFRRWYWVLSARYGAYIGEYSELRFEERITSHWELWLTDLQSGNFKMQRSQEGYKAYRVPNELESELYDEWQEWPRDWETLDYRPLGGWNPGMGRR